MKTSRRHRLANRVTGFILVLCGLLSLGCFATAPDPLPVKTTRANVSVFVKVDGFADVMASYRARQAETTAALGDESESLEKLESLRAQGTGDVDKQVKLAIEKELVRTRTAVVVQSEEKADIILQGTFVAAAFGPTLTWHIEQDEVSILAGQSESTFLDPATFASGVVAGLINEDLEQYANRPIGAPPGGPTPERPKAEPSALAGNLGGEVEEDPDAWAVIIGIEKYREEIPAATYAESDAATFEVFANKKLGVPRRQMKVLVGDRASRSDIASAIEEWLPKNARTRKSRVFVFFSGHGAPDTENGDAYLVPYDADPAYLKTRGYQLNHLYATLDKLPGRQMVFLDACFSGTGSRSVIGKGLRPLVPVAAPAELGVISVAAAKASQTTGAAPDAPHGLFSYFLMKGMAGEADADADSKVSLEELFTYVDNHVAKEARLQNREQQPTLSHPKNLRPAKMTITTGEKQ